MSTQNNAADNGDVPEHRRPSISFLYSTQPSTIKPDPAAPSTNKIIVDYLLFLSIQSRLQQAALELEELASPLHEQDEKEPEHIKRRTTKWRDTASRAERDKNAVESIVAGVLSDHRTRPPSSISKNPQLEQRLHLCQLTNLVFGRFDPATNNTHHSEHTISARIRKHSEHIVSTINNDDQDESHDIKLRRELFAKPIEPPFCRRHRKSHCLLCQTPPEPKKRTQKPTTVPPSAQLPTAHCPGLIDAIPAFLKTSADWLRMALESTSNTSSPAQPMTFAGERVMGGGMPPKWYDLFLEFLTQAVIESYLCDSHVGLQSIFEAFSYGDVEEEEKEEEKEEEEEDDEDDDDDHEDSTPEASEQADQENDEHEEELWGVRAEDHFLLFPKTRTIFLFSQQLREREKELLLVNGDLKTHFSELAERYPLVEFEKSMSDFIRMVLNSMDTPKLDKYEGSSTSLESETADDNMTNDPSVKLPVVYQFPGDGALLMPEVPDEENGSKSNSASESDVIRGTKRRHSTVPEEDEAHKRK